MSYHVVLLCTNVHLMKLHCPWFNIVSNAMCSVFVLSSTFVHCDPVINVPGQTFLELRAVE